MPTENPRITFTLSSDMLARIDEYRYGNRVKNQTKAIVDLLNRGLEIYETHAPVFKDDAITTIETKRIPIIGDTAAGQPIIANREYDEYIDVPIDGRKFDAAVRVTGDSMEPGYHIGDLALVRYMQDVMDGQIAVVILDDEVTLKRVYHDKDALILLSDNRKYGPIRVTKEEYSNPHIFGKVIGCIRWEE